MFKRSCLGCELADKNLSRTFSSRFFDCHLIVIFRNMRTLLKSTATTKYIFAAVNHNYGNSKRTLKNRQTKWMEIYQLQLTIMTF